MLYCVISVTNHIVRIQLFIGVCEFFYALPSLNRGAGEAKSPATFIHS